MPIDFKPPYFTLKLSNNDTKEARNMYSATRTQEPWVSRDDREGILTTRTHYKITCNETPIGIVTLIVQSDLELLMQPHIDASFTCRIRDEDALAALGFIPNSLDVLIATLSKLN